MVIVEYKMAFISDALGWAVIFSFTFASVLNYKEHSSAQYIGTLGFILFGMFWATLVPYYFLELKSIIETVASVAAIPLSFHAAYLLYNDRLSLLSFGRSIAIMGFIFMIPNTIPAVQEYLIEVVTQQTLWVLNVFGYFPELAEGPIYGYDSAIIFLTDGHTYRTYIEFACTGLGSIAMVAGVVASVKGNLKQKLGVLGVVIPVIWFLNIVRNAFIAASFGDQWFQWFVPEIMSLVGYSQPGLVSFFIGDRILSQFLSVAALAVIAYVLLRVLPGITLIFEDVLFVATRTEYDLSVLRSTDESNRL